MYTSFLYRVDQINQLLMKFIIIDTVRQLEPYKISLNKLSAKPASGLLHLQPAVISYGNRIYPSANAVSAMVRLSTSGGENDSTRVAASATSVTPNR